MQPATALPLATLGQPLFGSQWLALLAVLAGVAVFLLAVAALGRWLASTHPDEPPPPPAPAPAPAAEAPPEIFAIIAAAVAVTCGGRARVASVALAPADETAAARLQWSMEGRRQIYSSHKVR